MDDWTGRVIDGRYAVESVLGTGGMGLVLKARHKFTGVDVAVKVLRPELQLDMDVQMRFLGEARAPNAIAHPGIVQVVDAGKAPDGVLYLVMELLRGRPLRDSIASGELTHAEIRRIMIELFDALAAAHSRGFVHRDLKPENVFLAGQAGTVKLLDFGIAKVLDAGLSRVRTAAGVTLGTPAYMAPEQVNDASGVDARADLWAAGVMIYEMLSGNLPYSGTTTTACLVAIATQEPAPIRGFLPDAPPALEAFFERALSRDLSRRFATAEEMAQAFAALPLGFGVAALTVGRHAAPTGAERAAHAATLPAAPTAGAPAHAAMLPSQSTAGGSRSRAGLIIGVLGVLALVAAIGIVMMGRGGDKATANQGSSVPIDAAVVVQTPTSVDAASPPVADAAIVAQAVDAGVLTPSVDAAVGGGAPRDAGTRTVARDAGAKIAAGAKSDARAAPVDAGLVKSRCAASGTASCRSAMNCQRGCEDEDHACRCRCAASAHPSHEQAITAYATCAHGCGFGKICMGLNCKKVVATCLGR